MKIVKPLNSILIKPAGPDCNLNCDYCFYLCKDRLFKDSKKRMSLQTLEEMTRQALQQNSSNSVNFGWQGGEPSLMGLDFFQEAVKYQKKYGKGKSIGNGFQTNGILLDKNWSRFFRENQFLIGLSLDGPEEIHDAYRKFKNGNGSWKIITENLKTLLDDDVAVNAISVVNHISVKYPETIYHFHKEQGLNYMQFIPCLEKDPSTGEIASFCPNAEELGLFWEKLFDCWVKDFDITGPQTSIRFFDSVFYHYAGYPPPECTLLNTCGIYVVIEHNGNVYSCDFYVEPQWKLGNIHHGDLIHFLNSKKQNQFGQKKSSLPDECMKCRWLHLCRGGCPKDRDNNKLSYFCSAYKHFFQYSHEKYLQLAEDWKKKNHR